MVEKKRKKFEKNNWFKKNPPPPKKRDVSKELEEKIDDITSTDKYLKAINDTITALKYLPKQSGQGVGRYKQTRRNAYKLQDNHYGGLLIDVTKLMNEMKLNAYRGGNLVYQADADKSIINLLTKRFKEIQPKEIQLQFKEIQPKNKIFFECCKNSTSHLHTIGGHVR